MGSIYRSCPICNSMKIENIRRISFNMDNIMPDFYFLSKCNTCGFVYANTPATSQDYNRYYEENNRYNSLPTQDTFSIKVYEKIIGLIRKYIDKNDNVLDIGCGSGNLLKFMKLDGYNNLTGLDPAQKSIDNLLELGIRGKIGNIYDEIDDDDRGKFDVIILSGVLEHLYDLNSAMKNLVLYLRPGGKVLCFIPNALEYYMYPLPLPNYINIEHINHFSPNTAINLFANNGFSLLECNSVAIDFGIIPDPTLLLAFEYTDTKYITSKNIHKILRINDLKQERFNAAIDELISSGRPIAIFGTGNFARAIILNTNILKGKIICFVDNDKSIQGKSFCGYKVKSPDFLCEFDGDILILSMHGYKDIKKQIQDMGIPNKVIVLERE